MTALEEHRRREQSYGAKHILPDWLDVVAQRTEQQRQEYFVRLITIMSFELTDERMQRAIDRAKS